jgi:hypothetical protein
MSSTTPDAFANRAFAIDAPLRSNASAEQDLKIGRTLEGLLFPSVPRSSRHPSS